MFGYHYAGKTSGRRYEKWREEFARNWVVADFEPTGEDYFVNRFSGSEHSFLGLCRMHSTPGCFYRQSEPRSSGFMYVLIAAGSVLRAQQCGRSIELSFGQMTLVSADEPAEVALITEGNRWSIRVPHRLLADYCGNVDDKIARLIDASDLTKLLSHHIETAHRLGPKLGASGNHAIAQHTLDLVGLCLGADRDATHLAGRRGLAAVRLDAIKADILQRLGNADLAVGQIATAQGVSTRYVQHLFELSGQSFTSFVLEQRLLAAHRLLREPKSRWRKVSDIAAATGFSDISYFNRVFRNRFDATPTEIRVGFQQRPRGEADSASVADEKDPLTE